MVKVYCKQRNPDNLKEWIYKDLYLDGYLKFNLDLAIGQLRRDFDQVWFIDGTEGSGKSTLAKGLAYYVNKVETRHTLINRICLTPEEFDKVILSAEKYEAVVLDEAFSGMSASGTMSKINRVLQRRFTEIRAKNLFVFILAPSFMDIMRYFAIWRSKCLLHVYLGKKQQRGFFSFYGEVKKRKLYMLGKKNFYSYKSVAPQFTGRFTAKLKNLIDDDAYTKKKMSILGSEDKKKELTHAVIKRGQTQTVMQNIQDIGLKLTPHQISAILGLDVSTIRKYAKGMREKEAMRENILLPT